MFCMRPDFFIFLLSFIIVPQLKILYDNVMYLMLWTLFYMESWECPANALSQWLSTTSHNNASLKVATAGKRTAVRNEEQEEQGAARMLQWPRELLAINQWRCRGRTRNLSNLPIPQFTAPKTEKKNLDYVCVRLQAWLAQLHAADCDDIKRRGLGWTSDLWQYYRHHFNFISQSKYYKRVQAD